jgi:hypothetical protein
MCSALAVLAVLAAGLLVASPAAAAVSGSCVNCHTMHNSQDGTIPTGGSASPQGHLTLNTCFGCHSTAVAITAPKVDGTYAAGTDRAGGTFSSTECTADSMLHNVGIGGTAVNSVTGLETTLTTVPGVVGAGMNLGAGTNVPADLTCAGENGCHGDTSDGMTNDGGIRGFHHGSKLGWRYLRIAGIASDLASGQVLGESSTDWELGGATATNHNVYSADPAQGISKLCANCHGVFHGDNTDTDIYASGAWIRHPTLAAIPAAWTPTVDYENNPFSFADLASAAPDAAYTKTGAAVSCLSCHRAHGSPYADILRFDYSAQDAGSAVALGCLGCHNLQRG